MSISVIGDAFIDMICPVEGVEPGETYHRNMVVTCGGSATVAVLVARLGEEAKFLGKVGDDALGRYFKENLSRNGVSDLTFLDSEHPTGLCLSLVSKDGERSMIASRGANDYLTKKEVGSRIEELTKSKIAYFSGYSMLSPSGMETALYAMGKCRQAGCELWFNPGAPNLIPESFTDIIRDFVNVLVMNKDEAKVISRADTIEEALDVLEGMVDLAIITLSKEGCIVSVGKRQLHVPSDIIKGIIDTTGAGDAFSAGFIVGRLRQMSEVECANLAHNTAATFLREKVGLWS